MARVGVITDSVHGLNAELLGQYDIRVAPMGVNVVGRGYLDMIDITPARFYEILKQMEEPGRTNAASPGAFLGIYEDLRGKTDGMIYIGISGAMTATVNNARLARNIFNQGHPGTEIEVIDSKNCMGAQGFLVLEAARAAQAGKNLAEITGLVRDMVPRIKYLSLIRNLKLLARTGLVPRSLGAAANLGVRPIIGVTDDSGLTRLMAQVRASQGLEQLVDRAGKYIEPGRPVHAFFHYAEDRQEAEKLCDLFTARFPCVETHFSEYTPVSLCSTGNMTGVSFYT